MPIQPQGLHFSLQLDQSGVLLSLPPSPHTTVCGGWRMGLKCKGVETDAIKDTELGC